MSADRPTEPASPTDWDEISAWFVKTFGNKSSIPHAVMHGLRCMVTEALREGEEQGRRAERAEIVAYLRDEAGTSNYTPRAHALKVEADDIEQGAHARGDRRGNPTPEAHGPCPCCEAAGDLNVACVRYERALGRIAEGVDSAEAARLAEEAMQTERHSPNVGITSDGQVVRMDPMLLAAGSGSAEAKPCLECGGVGGHGVTCSDWSRSDKAIDRDGRDALLAVCDRVKDWANMQGDASWCREKMPWLADFNRAVTDAHRALPRRESHPATNDAKAPTSATMAAISAEVCRARTKFPGNRMMLAALTEEVGEVAKALLQKLPADEVRKEAVQVACVAIRIIEEGDASFADLTEEESKGVPPPMDPERAAQRSLDRIRAIRRGGSDSSGEGQGGGESP